MWTVWRGAPDSNPKFPGIFLLLVLFLEKRNWTKKQTPGFGFQEGINGGYFLWGGFFYFIVLALLKRMLRFILWAYPGQVRTDLPETLAGSLLTSVLVGMWKFGMDGRNCVRKYLFVVMQTPCFVWEITLRFICSGIFRLPLVNLT